jgi:VCBS repeat protein/flagellar hook capping protein FlgD
MNRSRLSRRFRLLALSSIALAGFLAGSPAHAGYTPLLRRPEYYDLGGVNLEVIPADFNLDGHQDLFIGAGTKLTVIPHSTLPTFPPLFQTPQGTSSSYNALFNATVADFNGDGRPDVAVGFSGAINGVGIWRSTSSGLVHVRDYTPYSFAHNAQMAAGDLNGDGLPDLVLNTSNGVAIFLAVTPDSLAPASYETVTPKGPGPYLALADVTGDGVLDIVTTAYTSDTLGPPTGPFYMWVLKGAGNGTFIHVGPYPVSNPGQILVATLNSDGIPDIALGTDIDSLTVFFGSGGGSFLPPTTFALGNSSGRVAMGDVDNDGDMDLVRFTSAGLGVSRNDGNGNFTLPASYTPIPPLPTNIPGTLLDVNEDGWLDFVAPLGTHTMATVLNDGAGGFVAPNTVQALGSISNAIVIDDFNRDGRPDLASAEDPGQDVMVAAGLADGTFQSGNPIPIGSTIHAIAAGDMNRDSKDDLVVAANSLYFFQNDGFGQFQAQGSIPGSFLASCVVDMNRDGRPDVVASDGSNYWAYLQDPVTDWTFTAGTALSLGSNFTQVAAGDWNRDGIPDLAFYGTGGIQTMLGNGTGNLNGALATVQAGRKYTSLCLGDFNRDGITDIAAREDATGITGSRGADVFFGNGAGGFAPAQSTALLEPKGWAIGTWDVNYDGLPDLIASGSPQFSMPCSIDILIGAGGPFGHRTSYDLDLLHQTIEGANSFAFGDVNRDGGMDILSARTGFIETTFGTPPSFGTAIQNAATYTTLSNPGCVVLGDVNRDGILDAVTSTVNTAPGVAVSLGQTGGTLGTSATLSQSWAAWRVALADMNRDGKLDIVASNYGFGLPRISTMLGQGDGTFGLPLDRYINAGNDFDIGDMDRDGIPDVVTSDADSVSIFRGTGSGTIIPFPLAQVAITPVYDLDVADLNRDGYLDVVCASGSVRVMYGGPGGTLSPPVTLSAPLTTCQTVCVGDVNRDGFPDIVANDGTTYYVIRGAPFAPFSTFAVTPLTFTATDMQVGAAAGNGVPYVYALRNAQQVELLSVSLPGALADIGSALTLPQPANLALGDMNRDGAIDAVSVSQIGSSIAVNLHGLGTISAAEITPPPAPAVEALQQNYPNPFNPETTIRYILPTAERARLDVYDTQGRWVARLEDGNETAGYHTAKWDGRTRQGTTAGSGVYFYRLTTSSGHAESRAMVLLK